MTLLLGPIAILAPIGMSVLISRPVDGIAGLGEVIKALGTDRPRELAPATGSYETIGGFVMHRLRRVARKADRIEAAGFIFEVVDVEGFRINQLLVTRRP
ncbi:transporter associated domain-containing protein [Lichenicola cladoniae]|uniref:transporter associated domain-containing protein n=1 Tax=Lichenicola cladoniae TaxID=1484109 RepID=UPI0038D11D14